MQRSQMGTAGWSDEVRAEIERANSRLSEGARKSDASLMASGYGDGAVLLPPDGDVVRGKGSIERFWQGALESGVKEATLTTLEVLGEGDHAQEMGTGVITVQEAGGTVEQKIKYVVVWERTAGVWRIQWDIWNSSP